MSNEDIKNDENSIVDFPVGVFSHKIYYSYPHRHIEYEIFWLDEGDADFYIEDTCHSLHKNDIIFLEADTVHYVKNPNEDSDFHYYALCFDISIIGKENDSCRKIFEQVKIHRFLSLTPELCSKIRNYVELKKENSFACNFYIKTLILEILSHLFQTNQYALISPYQESNDHRIFAIDVAIDYIKNHFRENISLKDLLEPVDYSKSHFCRLFKEKTGLNVTEYINQYRVEKACLDLIYSKKNITEIATENGFNNIQYFSRIFKQFMKCTPKQYQKLQNKQFYASKYVQDQTAQTIIAATIQNSIM